MGAGNKRKQRPHEVAGADTATAAPNGTGPGEQQAPEEQSAQNAGSEPKRARTGGKSSHKELFKAPDAAEVMEMSQTKSLYKSNLFRLQLESLLDDLRPRSTMPSKRLEAVLRTLQQALLKLQPSELPADLGSTFPNVKFLQPQHPRPLPFRPPKRVDIVGSFLLGTYCRTSEVLKVDVAVEMSLEGFKDYLNFRYADKRAAYCAELCRQLRALCGAPSAGMEALRNCRPELAAMQGDVWRPCVEVRLPEGEASRWVIRLLPTAPAGQWEKAKLAATRNAVRPQSADGATIDVESLPPTPHYNSNLLEDSQMRAHLEIVHKAIQRLPQLRDAILLLRHWALVHGFLSSNVGESTVCTAFSGFCLTLMATHTSLTSSVVSSQTSAIQLFKLTLSLLSSTDWDAQKVMFGKAALATLSPEEQVLCKAHFYDQEGINILWRSGPFIDELKHVAKETLHTLDVSDDPYDAVFGSGIGALEHRWDLVVRIPPMSADALCPGLGAARGSMSTVADRLISVPSPDCPAALALAQRLSGLLHAGLGNRCFRTGVRLLHEMSPRWQTAVPTKGPALLICFTLDATNLERAVDRGPSAQEGDAVARFKLLWGEKKTELRRFKDGSIMECVGWTRPPIERKVESPKKPAVVTQVIHHLLKTHFSAFAEGVQIIAGPAGFFPSLSDRGRVLWSSFEAFRTHLCQLSSLPLTIKDVHPATAGLSYTETSVSVAPLASDGIDRPLHETVVEFESSARWPQEPAAAQKVCLAMLLQMQEELQNDLGIESGIAEEGFLDVRYPNVTFRVRVFHPHELLDVANKVTNIQAQVQSGPPEPAAVQKLQRLWWKPRLCAAIRSQAFQQPAFAGAVLLSKRWMASQMLSGYEDFVEHLVSSVFLQPSPFQAPTSPQVGFCRFCRLLAEFPWALEPLIVDFDGKLTAADKDYIRKSFQAFRQKQGLAEAKDRITLWVASRFDPHALLLDVPPATVGVWLRGQAREVLAAYRQCITGASDIEGAAGRRRLDWSALYTVNTDIFDIVLQLTPSATKGTQVKKGGQLAQQRKAASQAAARGLVENIKSHLSPVCLVFHDIDGNFIALKWRPGAFLPQPSSILMGAVPHAALPAKGDRPTLCVPDILCLASIVSSLSAGLVADMRVNGI
mmetsp:Transcript_41642/g.75572  ORF Transcript_41642/g.75572 Transcript_41642/m.75572 type:complete len:1143 (-) Transcript_41642:16-3444(-)